MMLQDANSLSEFMCGLCQAISEDMARHHPPIITSELAALDIASGYHSYVFEIKKHQQKV